jgi:hypothetical protein
MATKNLLIRAEFEPGEVKEGDEVAVSNVEEEVRRSRVVTILKQLDEWKSEEPLIEVDGSLDVT